MGKKEAMEDSINKRVCSVFRSKMNHLFKEVLSIIDRETQELGPKFHANEKGFQLIRKTLLNHGNDVIRLMDLIILQLELTPKKSIVDLSKVKNDNSRCADKNTGND